MINMRSLPFQLPLTACGIYLALTLLSYIALFAFMVIRDQGRGVFVKANFWHWAAASTLLWFISFTVAWFILIPKPPQTPN